MTQHVTRLVIGVGNEDRGDDGVGPLVASRLKPQAGDRFEVLECRGDGASLMDAWKDADTVIILDAAMSGAEAGTIHRIDASTQPMPKNFLHYSTHAFSVAEGVELARALSELPRRVIVYGIEGEKFGAGDALSPAVEKAAREVEALVLRDLDGVFGSPARENDPDGC